jgi:site-specific recombinase XerD
MADTALIPYQFTIDAAIAEWLAQKEATGGSRQVLVDDRPRTRTGLEYERTMESFRHFLARGGLDVLPIIAQTEQEINRHAIDIARLAGLWANTRQPARLTKDGAESHRFDTSSPVSASMYNQRLAILSSFYTFVQDTYKLAIPNPIKDVKRRKVQPYAKAAADAIPPEEIEQGLDSIDRSTSEGLRDYAILAVALYTGRRASELVGLRGQDVKLQGRAPNTRIMLTFRAKGDKTMHDLLDTETSAVLLDYLHAQFGKRLQTIPPDAPIWISYSRNATRGQAISIRTLSNIVAAHLPTSKVHAIRHSFAVGMIRSGAPITDLADHLGHTDIKITRIYTKELTVAENKYGDLLVKRFGIKRKKAR